MTAQNRPVEITLSAVVQLIDEFTGQPAEGVAALFTVDGCPWRPLAKPQAFYAFTGLALGTHAIEVAALGFFPQRCGVTVPPPAAMAEAIVTCALPPDPLYPYPAWIPLVRGRVCDEDGKALAGVAVTASYQNRNGAPRDAQTRTSGTGAYDGRYALPLGGRLGATASATLTFSKSGYADETRHLLISSAATQFMDVVLAQA